MSSPNPSPRRSHLKVTRSVSNLRVPSVASTTGSPLAHGTEVLASSSSSMNNVDMSDRILVPEPEADVEAVVEQQNAVGQMDATASDEERKENLRAKLRNTLSKKQSFPGKSQHSLRHVCFVAEGIDGIRCWSPVEEEREVDRVERVDRNSPFVVFLISAPRRKCSRTGLCSQRTSIPLDNTLSSRTQANLYSRLSGTKTP